MQNIKVLSRVSSSRYVMEENFYDPYTEAKVNGLKVKFIDFKKINSFLTKSVIYLRLSMNKIEKRYTLTYELVHLSRNHSDFCEGHSLEEEEIIRQETAKKLIQGTRFSILIESSYSLDKIAKELQITKEVIYDYFKYCRKNSSNTAKLPEKEPSAAICKV